MIKLPLKKIITKQRLIAIGIIIIVVAVGIILRLSVFKPAPKKAYSVAVAVRNQNNPNKDEDRRTSLKSGDVLLVTDENHNWSRTESISYLLLKMNLNEKQAAKLRVIRNIGLSI